MEDRALEQRSFELALELPAAPFFPDGLAQVKLPLLGPFALAQNDQMVRPGQLCQHCCH